MPFTHHLQRSRFELKYIMRPSRARAVRDYIRSYLDLDKHAAGKTDNLYDVHSLYLDTPDRALCRQTMQGLKNRFKLRIRYYSDDPASVVYLEIKRRVDQVILKQRAAVTRAGAQRVLDGGWLGRSQIVGGGLTAQSSCRWFCELRDRVGATGSAYVSYDREAYVSPNSDRLRVTFDRRVIGGAYDRFAGFNSRRPWVAPRIDGVILEIKFTDRFPRWLRDMVTVFDLDRCSMAKYVSCVMALRQRPELVATTLKGLVLTT